MTLRLGLMSTPEPETPPEASLDGATPNLRQVLIY
jgi:hypothetical protein